MACVHPSHTRNAFTQARHVCSRNPDMFAEKSRWDGVGPVQLRWEDTSIHMMLNRVPWVMVQDYFGKKQSFGLNCGPCMRELCSKIHKQPTTQKATSHPELKTPRHLEIVGVSLCKTNSNQDERACGRLWRKQDKNWRRQPKWEGMSKESTEWFKGTKIKQMKLWSL